MTVRAKQRTAVGLLAVLAVVAAALLAVFGLPYGASNPEAFAHLYTHPVTGNQTHLHIDADITNGTRPCDPIDATATVAVGAVHSVGVCLETYPAHGVANFQLTVYYSGDPSDNVPPVLNLAPTVPFVSKKCNGDSSCLDANPDANDTKGTDTNDPNYLGSGWDCTGLGLAPPKGDDPATPNVADAFIVCNTDNAAPDQDLASDPGLLATISFTAQAAGTDVLDFGPADGTNTTNVQYPDVSWARRCGNGVPADQMGCFGATITKVADLSVVKTLATNPILAGGQVTFNLAIASNAPPTLAFAFDDLPNGLVYNDAATIAANGAVDYCDPAVAATPAVPGGDGAPVIVCGDILGVAGGGWTAAPEAMILAPKTIHIVADVPLAFAGKGGLNPVIVGPTDPNPTNNYSAVQFSVAPAAMTITDSGLPAVNSVGDVLTWTVTATSTGVSPASSVVITKTVDANQCITAATLSVPGACVISVPGTCPALQGTKAVCTVTNPVVAPNAVVATITAKVVASTSNACTDVAMVEWADPLSATANGSVVCLPPTVRMEKDTDQNASVINNAANLCLIKNPQGGLQCLTIYELVSNPGDDPTGVGAFEFELKYDHNIFQQPVITPTSWLSDAGRTVDCSMTIINENSIWFACVSTGPAIGQTVNGTIATITLCPQPDLVNRLTPGQDNGVASPILDENCEMANPLGDPLTIDGTHLAPGILPGGQVAVCSDMEVTVRILEGDLNLDGVVNVLDEGLIAYRYGATFGSLLYSPWYDLQPNLKDYDIDIKDLQKVWGRQGSVCSLTGAGTIPSQTPVPLPDP